MAAQDHPRVSTLTLLGYLITVLSWELEIGLVLLQLFSPKKPGAVVVALLLLISISLSVFAYIRGRQDFARLRWTKGRVELSGTISVASILRPINGSSVILLDTTLTVSSSGSLTVSAGITLASSDSNSRTLSISGAVDIDGATLTRLEVDFNSGSTGRIVNMLLDARAAHVIALEPSEAEKVLRLNTADRKDRITYVRARGEELPLDLDLDFVLSIGVLHCVVDPGPVVRRAYEALKPGGVMAIWLYGREGNELYLRLVLPLRVVTQRIPDFLLRGIVHILTVALIGYIGLCRRIRLPMRDYVLNVLGKYTYGPLFITVFDQLNPAYARYYTGEEAEALLSDAGFQGVEIFRRHSYSWTVVGRKPI